MRLFFFAYFVKYVFPDWKNISFGVKYVRTVDPFHRLVGSGAKAGRLPTAASALRPGTFDITS